ncbi:MAG: PrgI family protein [Sporomusa sp.]
MAYVPVPKDLNRVKTKVAFNLTKRQIICFSCAAAIGIPTYIFTRKAIGNDVAMFLMIGLMLPFFFLAMYERNGQPAEKIIRNYLRAKFFWPQVRTYKTDNLYKYLEQEEKNIAKQDKAASQAGKTSAVSPKAGKKKQSRA